MNVIGIIPARMAASRFPNKPMADIMGIPMIGHCYIRSAMCTLFDDVYVATCDKIIVDYVESIGGKAIMTSDTHERASDRTAEALVKIEEDTGKKIDVVVMLQGDEPLILLDMLAMIIKEISNDPSAAVVNLMQQIKTKNEVTNPNNVKVVTDINGYALYFSREPIPSNKKYHEIIQTFKQLGLIAFKRNALLDFMKLKPGRLEIIESVDMNRFLEHGRKIKMINSPHKTWAIDTPDDLKIVNNLMMNDGLFLKYKNKS